MHIVTLASLIKLSRQAFDESGESDYDLWKAKQTETSANAFYWQKYIDLQIQLFMFVRSVREGNISLFIRCIEQILP